MLLWSAACRRSGAIASVEADGLNHMSASPAAICQGNGAIRIGVNECTRRLWQNAKEQAS